MKIFITVIFVLINLSMAQAKDASVYDLETKWLSTENQEQSLSFFTGHYALISMVYTSCPHACPLIIQKIENLNSELEKAGFKDISIILASFDSKNDTPEKLKKYRQAKKLAAKKWHFLAAKSDAAARELSVVLNISYKDLGDGDFSHSNVITLLDKEGRILKVANNLNFNPQDFIQALRDNKK